MAEIWKVPAKRYKDLDGDSGISRYAFDANSITIEFKSGSTYLYTYSSTRKKHVEAMKKLATEGVGLATYINQHVRDRFEERLS
jgi:hypothetical protein